MERVTNSQAESKLLGCVTYLVCPKILTWVGLADHLKVGFHCVGDDKVLLDLETVLYGEERYSKKYSHFILLSFIQIFVYQERL